MRTRQLTVADIDLETADFGPLAEIEPQLVFVFASVEAFQHPFLAQGLALAFACAHRVGCSTAGEISGKGVSDRSVVVTAVRFDRPDFRVAASPLTDMASSHAAGRRLAEQLSGPGLHSMVILGQGVDVNGSALIEGVTEVVGNQVVLTGGLAGDAGAFTRTWTLCDEEVSSRNIVGIGFYGETIRIAHGSFGGWQPFGPARRVTRASGNVLYELDGQPALDLYMKYLGEHAESLPRSGLLFPFAMLGEDHSDIGLIRTILGTNYAERSLVLAGDIAQDGYLRLMHANTNALVGGAETAAKAAKTMVNGAAPGVAILISCVGRKLVMGGRVDEEVEAVADVLGVGTSIAGFYSNGEISPYIGSTSCELHNQTMTITYLHE